MSALVLISIRDACNLVAVASGAPLPLSADERARLPEHLRYLDRYRYSADSFDNREGQLDAIDRQREWLAAQRRAA